MEVSILVDSEVARGVRRGHRNAAWRQLERVVGALGGELQPQHPGPGTDEDISWYSVVLSDERDPELVERRLRACRATRAAFVKPLGEPPA